MNDAGCFQDGVEGGTFDTITAGRRFGGTSLTAAVPGIRGRPRSAGRRAWT